MGNFLRTSGDNGSLLFLIPLWMAGSLALWPQDELVPETPEFILPPFLVEMDREGPVMVEAPLPLEAPLGLPPLELPLPDPGELRFSPSASEVRIPIAEPVVDTPSPRREDRNFFSRSRLGGGYRNHILGDISLFKRGEGPRLTLRFRHNSRDGFGEVPEGEDFIQREGLLEGRLNLAGKDWTFDTDIGYREEEFGLPDLGNIDSLNMRRYIGGTAASLNLSSSGRFNLSVDAEWMERWSSGGTSDSREETLLLIPRGDLAWNLDPISLGISGAYRYNFLGGTGGNVQKDHSLEGTLRLEGRLPRGWNLTLEGGVLWRPGGEMLYPLALEVTGFLGNFLFLALTGGYKDQPYKPGTLQEEHPFLALRDAEGVPAAMSSRKGWGGSLSLRWTPTENLLFEGGGGIDFWKEMIQPDAPLSTGRNSLRREDRDIFTHRLSGAWLIHPLLRLSASWEGQALLGTDLLEPLTRLALRFEMGGEADASGGTAPPWGGHIGGDWEVYSDESPYPRQYPKVEVSGYYEVTREIRLVAEIKDILSLFIDEGRLIWEDLRAPGFLATLMVALSF